MAWNASAHPRVLAGASGGGQFTVASSSGKKKPAAGTKKSAATKTTGKSAKLTTAKKVRSSKGRKTVTVKKGDTLSAIARRNHETLGQLKKDNPRLFSKAHRGGNLIFPGNKVKVRSAAMKAKPKGAKLTSAKKVRSTAPKRAVPRKAATPRRKG
jgi:LysM repeat protein